MFQKNGSKARPRAGVPFARLPRLATVAGTATAAALSLWLAPHIGILHSLGVFVAILMIFLSGYAWLLRERRRLLQRLAEVEEAREKLKLQLDTVRFRTGRLREELLAANKQARLSHQLTLLGQFTAGFMHEFNNPLAIVEGRLEVLREERGEDTALLADIDQMLKETRYMAQVARTLLQALRKERSPEVFEPCDAALSIEEAVKALRPKALHAGVILEAELADAPRVNVPDHVVVEVLRNLTTNAINALEGRERPRVWILLAPYRSAGARVVLRVEDNGPGVSDEIRQHLFEPFVSQANGQEGLGLGLFLTASLLDMYDGSIRYEPRAGGGASFVIELPPARFTRDQPYHWFAGGGTE